MVSDRHFSNARRSKKVSVERKHSPVPPRRLREGLRGTSHRMGKRGRYLSNLPRTRERLMGNHVQPKRLKNTSSLRERYPRK